MRTFAVKTFLFAAFLGVTAVGAFPGEVLAQSSPAVAPTFIPVSGRLLTASGEARGAQVVQLVIALYDGQNDTTPRWIEQQEVTLDAAGGYSVQFGATLPDGLPLELFATDGGARWLGVAVQNVDGSTVEQPRAMLVAVPYAAKAASAETLGGKSASEFVLSSTFREDLRNVLQEEGVTPGGDDVGTEAILNSLQKSNGAGALLDSAVYEVGGNVGIGTASPGFNLTVGNGSGSPILAVNGSGFPGFLFQNGASTLAGLHYDVPVGAFRIYAGGTSSAHERMVITSSGNVGIGTATPGFNLVVGNGSGSPILAVNGNGFPGFLFQNGGTTLAGLHYDVPGGAFRFYAGGTSSAHERMSITSTGNVGIGTASPTNKLHVVGNAAVTGNVTVDGNIAAKYQDVAEWVDSAEPLEAGTVVVIDIAAKNRVKMSTKANDARVAGAISPQPGLVLGEAGEGRVLVAQSGRVRIKADTRNGAIKPGDLLVTSPRAGYAMKAKSAKPGTVLGKALEPLDKGTGEILVLLTLQ